MNESKQKRGKCFENNDQASCLRVNTYMVPFCKWNGRTCSPVGPYWGTEIRKSCGEFSQQKCQSFNTNLGKFCKWNGQTNKCESVRLRGQAANTANYLWQKNTATYKELKNEYNKLVEKNKLGEKSAVPGSAVQKICSVGDKDRDLNNKKYKQCGSCEVMYTRTLSCKSGVFDYDPSDGYDFHFKKNGEFVYAAHAPSVGTICDYAMEKDRRCGPEQEDFEVLDEDLKSNLALETFMNKEDFVCELPHYFFLILKKPVQTIQIKA